MTRLKAGCQLEARWHDSGEEKVFEHLLGASLKRAGTTAIIKSLLTKSAR